jgi:hypothetical protein
MAKKKSGPAAAVASQPREAGGKGITKVEAVRRALEELGSDAKRSAIQGFLRERFGIEMSPDHISNCKGDLRRRGRGKKKPAGQKRGAQGAAPAPPPGPPARPPRAAGGGISVEDVRLAKGLVERVGAERLRDLIDVLSR